MKPVLVDQRTTRIEGGRRLREAKRNPPLISIITVVFRAGQELKLLLESIIAQLGEDSELIVIDGGSDDGSIDVLRHFDNSIDYWISEPDRGIYYAMNKGIVAARGEYVLHLNAGDRLRCIPRESLRRCLSDGIDVACFSVNVVNWGDYPPRSGFRLRIENSWHHQGIFYRRKNHPGYDLQYRVFADFDCNQKLIKGHKSIALFREVIAEQVIIGASGSGIEDNEIYHIIRKNFGIHYAVLAFFWNSLKGLRILVKRLLTFFDAGKK
jgi:glycosyltransferase involved in cell wall biosynthesis